MNVKGNKMKKAIYILCLILFQCAYFNTFYNARKSFKRKEYDKTIEKSSVILAKYQNSRWVDDAILLIARSFYHKAEYDKALIKFTELEENFPESDLIPESNFWWGMTLLKMEDFNLAEARLKQATETNIKKEYKSVFMRLNIGFR